MNRRPATGTALALPAQPIASPAAAEPLPEPRDAFTVRVFCPGKTGELGTGSGCVVDDGDRVVHKHDFVAFNAGRLRPICAPVPLPGIRCRPSGC